jgi:uncharacterized protein YndB with AHSA1/START domain
MKEAKLQIVKQFRAPPQRVFAACTDPAQLARWFMPKGFRMVQLHADVHVDGRLSFTMESSSGRYAAEGVYEFIDPPHKLVHSWRWTEGPLHEPADDNVSRVTYEFESFAGGTRLTLTHEKLKDQTDADNHALGWTEALEALEALLKDRETRS